MMSGSFSFGRVGRALACLIAVGIVSGFSASEAKANKKLDLLPYMPTLDVPPKTPHGHINPKSVFVNVGNGKVVYDKKKHIWELVFVISFTKPKDTTVKLTYFTRNINADPGKDFLYEKGTVTFKPYQTSYLAYVPIVKGRIPHAFYLKVLDASNDVEIGLEGKGIIP